MTLADEMQCNVAEAGTASQFESREESPPAMAIVGLEDDLSTIANDTVDRKMVQRSREAPLSPTPKKRDFKEYSPRKKKSPAGESDEDTAPETPPGLIQIPGRKNTAGTDGVKPFETKSSDEYMALEGRRTKRIFIIALILGLVLIASIGALAIALIRLRQEDSTTTSAIDEQPEQQETNLPSSAPVQQGASPFQETTQPPVLATRDDLFQVLAQLTPGSLELLEDIDTPQYRAFSWLSSDPNYFDYDDSRLIQRWVLAIFYLSFEGGNLSPFNARYLESNLLTEWMSYSDECFWHSTGPDGFCNEEGLVRNIDIRGGGISGTLPKELGLLSNSLESIFLPNNLLFGTLPSELAKLSLLKRLQLSFNRLEGPILTDFGLLRNLELFSLGGNQLIGTLPTELGSLSRLDTLGLERNKISGSIPSEFGRLDRLVFLALDENELTGIIPDTLGDLSSLQSLRITNNAIVGEVPVPICDLKDGSLESIVVDCNIGCSCCTDECHAQPSSAPSISSQSPSPKPTLSPTSSPTSTPSFMPTSSPTSSPTQCFVELIVDEADCIPVGDAIHVSFENCEPKNDDWIGIYDWDTDPEDLDNGFMWSWACGNQDCRTAAKFGEVFFDQNHVDETTPIWPLPEGWYIVYLIRRNPGGSYDAYAPGEFFRIRKRNKC